MSGKREIFEELDRLTEENVKFENDLLRALPQGSVQEVVDRELERLKADFYGPRDSETETG